MAFLPWIFSQLVSHFVMPSTVTIADDDTLLAGCKAVTLAVCIRHLMMMFPHDFLVLIDSTPYFTFSPWIKESLAMEDEENSYFEFYPVLVSSIWFKKGHFYNNLFHYIYIYIMISLCTFLYCVFYIYTCWLMAEQYDTKSNVKSQLEVSYMSSHTDELWYNETVCLWMTIYIYIYIYI